MIPLLFGYGTAWVLMMYDNVDVDLFCLFIHSFNHLFNCNSIEFSIDSFRYEKRPNKILVCLPELDCVHTETHTHARVHFCSYMLLLLLLSILTL